MRGANNHHALETISAAATAIASAENREPQASVQKRGWGSCWSIYSCFGSNKQNKRIGHAVLVPETTPPGIEVPAAENQPQATSVALPFVAPPSSPASFLQSEPPSCTQSPAGFLSLTSISASMYSPGPTSIFAIGPYAHETQLVSPPVFSTFTTEPSTAPFTPPPESVHLTTPSSPEVPFAQLLGPNHQNGEAGLRFPISQYEFQSYQFYPGSPVGHLISPSSVVSGSGTSSPFPDLEFPPGGAQLLQFQIGNPPPKLLTLEKLTARESGSQQGSGSLTPEAVGQRPLDRQNSDIAPLTDQFNGRQNEEIVLDPRVSFEITTEDVTRCMAKKPSLAIAASPSLNNADIPAEEDENSSEAANSLKAHLDEISDDKPEKASSDGEDRQQPPPEKHRSITLGSVKEFNFDNADVENSDKPNTDSDWWTNDKVLEVESEGETSHNWSFFPMMQPGVS